MIISKIDMQCNWIQDWSGGNGQVLNWQDGGAENKGEVQLNQEQAANLKQCRNRAYSKVILA